MVRTIFESQPLRIEASKPFRFVGRYSFLDFINTEASEADGRADLLTSDQDFVAWMAENMKAEKQERPMSQPSLPS